MYEVHTFHKLPSECNENNSHLSTVMYKVRTKKHPVKTS